LKSLFAFDDLPKIAKKSFFFQKKELLTLLSSEDLYKPNDKKLLQFLEFARISRRL
jgi:hypothetical protein